MQVKNILKVYVPLFMVFAVSFGIAADMSKEAKHGNSIGVLDFKVDIQEGIVEKVDRVRIIYSKESKQKDLSVQMKGLLKNLAHDAVIETYKTNPNANLEEIDENVTKTVGEFISLVDGDSYAVQAVTIIL